MNAREAVRGITVEGLVYEAEQFMQTRADLPWPVAFKAWAEVAGLSAERERAVKVEVLRRRAFQGKSCS